MNRLAIWRIAGGARFGGPIVGSEACENCAGNSCFDGSEHRNLSAHAKPRLTPWKRAATGPKKLDQLSYAGNASASFSADAIAIVVTAAIAIGNLDGLPVMVSQPDATIRPRSTTALCPEIDPGCITVELSRLAPSTVESYRRRWLSIIIAFVESSTSNGALPES